ncbi:MAG: DUF4296 domain-containing protein [Bacteroidales bacterium]|nr:DUF4296 domain-containing protein [Bacteroidales bacterium]
MGNRKFISYLLSAVLLLGLASCSDRMPIPRKVMQRIYYDMMLADSYVEALPDSRMASDSIAVYPPIIEKYGYTVDQFLASQAILLKDPEKMSKLFAANNKMYHDSAEALMARIHLRDSLADVEFQLAEEARVAMDEFLDSISSYKMLDTLVLTFTGDSLIIDTLFTIVDTTAAGQTDDAMANKPRKPNFEEPEETVDEIDMEFKELEEIADQSRKDVEEEKAQSGEKKSVLKRIFRSKEKKDDSPEKKRLKEIEEKFK